MARTTQTQRAPAKSAAKPKTGIACDLSDSEESYQENH